METIICMSGLGDDSTTFSPLQKILEKHNHRVIILNASSVRSHEDRIKLVTESHYGVSGYGEGVFLLGKSAGGGAVRVAAERLSKERERLRGVILLSPSMPREVPFVTRTTRTLMWTMLPRAFDLMGDKNVRLSEEEYERLISPLPEEIRKKIIDSRQTISTNEARELAFNPLGFVGYPYPTLHIWGDQDRWIAPRAQWELNKLIRGVSSSTGTCELKGAGHLILADERTPSLICDWIEEQLR